MKIKRVQNLFIWLWAIGIVAGCSKGIQVIYHLLRDREKDLPNIDVLLLVGVMALLFLAVALSLARMIEMTLDSIKRWRR